VWPLYFNLLIDCNIEQFVYYYITHVKNPIMWRLHACLIGGICDIVEVLEPAFRIVLTRVTYLGNSFFVEIF